ncbi:hypothetical protein OS493_035041 [Desmophyllum pertusum]|uniref:Phosphatase tensin-type domain-containing protein n=1 Tax=Desmophyllum pertusum TaxID=174260 RepID=A0A9W9ZXD1_9CNID|nr:hypothetical protein OS493_035041 [Desmophyllum pertusum]
MVLFFFSDVFPSRWIESTYKNNIDDVRDFLEAKYPENYLVINVSPRTYRTEKLGDRVINCCLVGHRLPPLERLISLCRKINSWLKTDRKHVVVIHCQDGKEASGVVIAAFFVFCKLFKNPMEQQTCSVFVAVVSDTKFHSLLHRSVIYYTSHN